MSAPEIAWLSIGVLSRLIRRGEISSREVTETALAQIDLWQPHVNAFISVLGDEALAAARAADRRQKRGGPIGPLHGIPVSLKDLVDYAGVPTTCASRLLANRTPAQHAAVVERLQQAGAIIIGKANMSEFAIGGMQPEYGWIRNPWDLTKTSGGSSGGSAASVATGMNYASIGSDTGGSMRVPSAFCGVVALKPTFGRISRRGMTFLAWSLDHLGPMTRSVEDAALVFQVLAGHDPSDVDSSTEDVPDMARAMRGPIKGMTVGIPKALYAHELDGEAGRIYDEVHRTLRRLGCWLKEVSLPDAKTAQQTHLVIMQAEGAAVHAQAISERPQDFSDFTREWFRTGALYSATTYLRAQQIRARILEDYSRALDEVDVLIMPSTPIPAHRPGEFIAGAGGIPKVACTTTAISLCGLPSLCLPCGFTSERLPMGMQIVGRPFAEATILKLGRAYERATQWPLRPTLPAGATA